MFKVGQRSTPLNEINSSTTEWRLLEEEERESVLDTPDDDTNETVILDRNLNCDVETDIVEYIAGYVVRSIQPKLLCQSCAKQLTDDENPKTNSLIFCKNRGGLVNPSDAVTKICRLSEKVLKEKLSKSNVVQNIQLLTELKMSLFKLSIGLNLFKGEHFFNTDVENSHFFLLIDAISKRYFNIRLKFYGKVVNEKTHLTKFRNDLCKKVLFAGQ